MEHFPIGHVVGHLTVIGEAISEPDNKGSVRWRYPCRCTCGYEVSVLRGCLQFAGPTKSCGCKRVPPPLTDTSKLEHFPIGHKIGHLTIIGAPEKRPSAQNSATWFYPCQCICGKTLYIIRGTLKNCNENKSCGCVNLASRTTHGATNTSLYRVWHRMKSRCGNPNADSFKWYGAKGIKVCDDWLDFTVFKTWAMASGYSNTLTIDRINPLGNYEPSNCRWITVSENSRRAHLGRKRSQ